MNEETRKQLNDKFGEFFEEFKDTSTGERLFYIIFVFRRVLISTFTVVTDSGLLQIVISSFFSFIVLFI